MLYGKNDRYIGLDLHKLGIHRNDHDGRWRAGCRMVPEVECGGRGEADIYGLWQGEPCVRRGLALADKLARPILYDRSRDEIALVSRM